MDTDAHTMADAVHDLLHARAQSLGAIDVLVDVDGENIDVELIFGEGPDMGLTWAMGDGACAVCELVGAQDERWLEDAAAVVAAPDAERGVDAVALELLGVVLDARRTLLRALRGEPTWEA